MLWRNDRLCLNANLLIAHMCAHLVGHNADIPTRKSAGGATFAFRAFVLRTHLARSTGDENFPRRLASRERVASRR